MGYLLTQNTIIGAREQFVPYIWEYRLPELAQQYQLNQPFPHIHLEGFLAEDIVRRVVQEFPNPKDTSWIQYRHYNENKLGKTDRAAFPPMLGRIIDELNSPQFVAWLSELTGIPGLIADPSLEGGGMHQTERGGFLNVHADFTHHHHQLTWHRRCNLILYLNDGWKEEWGGALELWNRDMSACVAKYLPLLNHAVIFNTTEDSYHGYPDAITPPEGISRKSIALYYYTVEMEAASVRRSTNYRARPGDGPRAALIWLDKKLLALYSGVKSKLGLSDKFASSVLGFLGQMMPGRSSRELTGASAAEKSIPCSATAPAPVQGCQPL